MCKKNGWFITRFVVAEYIYLSTFGFAEAKKEKCHLAVMIYLMMS